MKPPENLIKEIRENKQFYIVPHVFPDGDAVGSALALGEVLERLGKQVAIKSRDPLPAQYSFLPGSQRFSNDFNFPEALSTVLIIVDCNTAERAAVEKIQFKKTLVIDHHLIGDGDLEMKVASETAQDDMDTGNACDGCWVVPQSPATGLLIYHLINALSVEMTKSMAENLYTAISFDTGTFRYSNTTADALGACAKLVEFGVNPCHIANSLYNNWSEAKFLLFKQMMSSLEISGLVSTAVVTETMFKETGAVGEDTENFVNFPLMVNSIKLSVFFREYSTGKWKVSLRSQGDINVAAIAEHFGGGGHRNAAGCRVSGDIGTVKGLLLEKLKAL